MLFWVNVLSDILDIASKNLAQSWGKQRFKRIIPNVNDQSLLANLIMLKSISYFVRKLRRDMGLVSASVFFKIRVRWAQFVVP